MIELLKKNEDRIKTDESLLRNISYLNQLLKYSTIPETLIPDFESYMKRYEIRRKLKENGELIDDPNYLLRLFLIWMKLYEQQNDPRYLNVTLK